MSIILEVTIFVCLCITSFCLGFLLGKLNGIQVVTTTEKEIQVKKYRQKEQPVEEKVNIEIDSRKVVTDIKTDGLEKKYNTLGEVKQSTENIGSSINKLKNLRGS